MSGKFAVLECIRWLPFKCRLIVYLLDDWIFFYFK